MKNENDMEENMVVRKWQLAEMDATKPEWFNTCDMPYNKMWKADEFWKDNFYNGKKFKAYFCYDNQGKIHCMKFVRSNFNCQKIYIQETLAYPPLVCNFINKKFSLLLKVETSLFSNKLNFFSSNSIFFFFR